MGREEDELDEQIMADSAEYDKPSESVPMPEKKPSFIDSAKERIGKIGSQVKENIDAKRAEARQLEAEKKAARDEAKIVRKAAERKDTLQREYEKELHRKSFGQQISSLKERIPKIHAAMPAMRPERQQMRSPSQPRPITTPIPNMMGSAMQRPVSLFGTSPRVRGSPPRRAAKSVDLFRSGSSKMPDLFASAGGWKGMPSFGFSKGKKQKGFKLI